LTLENLLQFFGSSFLVILAARWLTRAADQIADLTGLGHLFVGSLFLAVATSAPEFFVDIEATRVGLPNLAAGDLLGSSLVNLVIFCLLVLLFWKTAKDHFSQGIFRPSLLAALLTSVVGLLIFLRPAATVFGVNIGSYLIVIAYLLGMQTSFKKSQERRSIDSGGTRDRPARLIRPFFHFFAGAVLIFFASPFLVSSVEKISLATGLGETFLGTSLLALTTSFPELAASVTAARMGLFHLMAGNIVGSNAVNMTIFALLDWIWEEGSLWEHLSRKNLIPVAFVVLNMLLLSGASYRGKASRAWIWLILFLSFGCYAALYVLKNRTF
jgi:cation:H+ antiporter